MTARGLIARGDRSDLARRYRAGLTRIHEGYYLPAYDRLVAALTEQFGGGVT